MKAIPAVSICSGLSRFFLRNSPLFCASKIEMKWFSIFQADGFVTYEK